MNLRKHVTSLVVILSLLCLFPLQAFAIDPPTLSLEEDTGIDNDGITTNGTILVGGLESGATWEYSINQGTSWNTGSGSSFVLDDATYPVGYIMVRQTNAGETSTSASNTSEIVVAGNLITNGDFQDGNTGFSSDYIYFVKTGTGDCDEGYYSIVSNPHDAHDGDGSYDSGFVNAVDHTLGTSEGLMFVANGSSDTTDIVWQSDSAITVEAGVEYRFEAYLMNLTNATDVENNYPDIHFQIGDGTDWTDLTTTDVTWTSNEEGIWHVTYADGVFSSSGTYYVRMLNDQDSGFNDFGLDDVYFGIRGAAPSASDSSTNPTSAAQEFDTSGLLTISLADDTGVSDDDMITNNGQINVSGLDSTTWQYSTNGGSSWTTGSGSSYTLKSDGDISTIVQQWDDSNNVWLDSSAPLEFTLDTVAPSLSSGSASSTSITLSFDEILNSDDPPAASDFVVMLDGTTTNTVTSLNVSGSSITLTLKNSMDSASDIVVSYTRTGTEPAISDIAGNETTELNSYYFYTVQYDANGATSGSAPSTQYKAQGEAITISGNTGTLALTGYTWQDWNTRSDGDGTDYSAGTSYTKDAALILYADWTANTYTVIFNPQNGEVTPFSKDVTYNSSYGTLPTPIRDNYSFSGWFTQTGGNGTEISDTTTVSEAGTHTLYAYWTANPQTITFNSNEGSALSQIIRSYGDPIGSLDEPTRTGYTFSGWYYDEDLNNAVQATDIVESSFTLYAGWTVNTHTVTYNENGAVSGSAPDEDDYDYDESVTVSDNTGDLLKPGYLFAGWSTSADGEGTVYAANDQFQMPDEDVILYALWKLNIVTAPQTGDSSRLSLWIVITALSMLGAFLVLRGRKTTNA